MGNVDGSFKAARVLHAETGGGPLATHSVPSYAWEKLSTAELESLGLTELIRQGRAGQSHVEYIVETFWFPPTPTPQGLSPRKRESYISLTSQAMTPLSIGNVTLRSNQIVEPLMINPAVCGPTSSASTLMFHAVLYRSRGHAIGPALIQEVTAGPRLESVREYHCRA